MRVTIRAAQPEDAELLATLNASVQALHVAARPALFRTPERAEVVEWFRAWVAQRDVQVWIAEAGDAPAGYAAVVARERADTPFTSARRWHELDQIGVEPRLRRQGVARALIEHVRAQARAAGITMITLRCWAFNDSAMRSFSQLGFGPDVIQMSVGV